MYALINAIAHTGTQELSHHAIVIEGTHIRDVVSQSTLGTDCPTVDLTGMQITSGFIDLQLNGCGGVMFNDAIASITLDTMHQTNLKSGTTSYLPTLITTSDTDMVAALEVVHEQQRQQSNGVLGLHLEGPYLNPSRKGIHNADDIRQPDRDMLQKIAAAGRETVKLITLAPEMVQPQDIQLLAEQGILVAAGHSDATYEQAIAGFDAGIRMATHLFNAMSPWQGRKPGLVGAVLEREEVYAGMIADGYHVHFASIHLAHKLKQDKLVLVTDATPPAGTQMDSFIIGGQQVFYQEGRCVAADGTLGGSALTMIEAVRNCVNSIHLPLSEALRMASLYPAQAIAVDHELGRIAPGYIADLAILSSNLQVVAIVERGTYQSFG
jgi:N-acetylglucosamine-6-phosphate deacetylase